MVQGEQLPLLQSLRVIEPYYDDNGFAVIPNVFSRFECDTVRFDAEKLADRLIDSPSLQTIKDKNNELWPALLLWPIHLGGSGAFEHIAFSERMQTIVKFFLNTTTVRHLNNQIYFRESGDGDEFAWHQDICFRTPPEDFINIENGYLQTIVCIDDLTEENGTIEFIPGSHRLGNLNLIPRDNTELGLRKFVRGNYSGKKLLAKKGDVVIWSVMTVHGSEQNNSGNPRMTYMNGFARDSAVVNKERFPLYV